MMSKKNRTRFLAFALAATLLVTGICPGTVTPVSASEVSSVEEAALAPALGGEEADLAPADEGEEASAAPTDEGEETPAAMADEGENADVSSAAEEATLAPADEAEEIEDTAEDPSDDMVSLEAAGEDTEVAGAFAFAAVTSDQVLIAPTMISYTAEDTIQDALAKSGYSFGFSAQSFLQTVEGVADNFSMYYDDGNYTLTEKASAISAMWITANYEQGYSDEMFSLVKTLGEYSSATDDRMRYTPLKDVYDRAVKSLYGASAASAGELVTELKNQYLAYETYLNAGTVTVALNLTNAEGKVAAGTAVFTDDYGMETSFEHVTEVSLRPGNYTYEISDSAHLNRFVRGSLTVEKDASSSALTAVFPDGDWISDIQLGLKSGYDTDNEAVSSRQGDHSWEKTYYVPDTAGTSLYPYITYESGIDITAIRPYLQGKTTNATNARSWKSNVTALVKSIAVGSLDTTALVIEARQTQTDYEQYTVYDLTIKRLPTLSSLEVTAEGTVLPLDFKPETNTYTVTTVSDTLTVSAAALCSGSTVQIGGKTPDENGSDEIALTDLTQTGGSYQLSVSVATAENITNTYVLYITKKDAVEVNVVHSSDVTVEMYNAAGARIASVIRQTTQDTYHLIPGDTYTWVTTKNSWYHAKADFIAAEGLSVQAADPKTADTLTSMSARSTSAVAAKNTVNYTMSPAFTPASHTYTIPISSSLAAFYLQQQTISDDYTATACFTSYKGVESEKELTSNAQSATILANLIGVSGKSAAVRVEVTQKNAEDGVIYYEDYELNVVRQMQLNSLTATDHEDASMVLFQGESETSGFVRSVYDYTTSIAKAAQTITLSSKLFSSVTAGDYDGKMEISCEDWSKTITFDEETNSPADVQTIQVPLDIEKDEETIEIRVSDTDPEALTGIYTIKVTKLPPVATTFTVSPEKATVFLVSDVTGNRIFPDENGQYLLNQTASYTCTVTAYGYISQKFTFVAGEDTAKQTITLKKAAEASYTDVSGEKDWPTFRGNDDNNGVTDIKTPTSAEDTYLNWAVKIGDGYGSGAVGCPILVGDYLYTYAGTSIVKVDKRTGQVVASGTMVASSSFAINSPTYADGMIFVGLSNGRIQAFRADTLASLWVYTDALGGQPNCQITYKDGYVYTGFWNSETKEANFACVSVTDEDPSDTTEAKPASWTYTDNGFYWAGAYAGDGFVLVTTDDGDASYTVAHGSVLSLDPLTGALIDSVQATGVGDLRSSVCYDSATDAYYFTSKGGDFYQIKVNTDGTFVENSLRKLHLDNGSSDPDTPPMSTSTPVIYNGRAYIGVSGTGQFMAYSGHNITVIDLNSWTIAYSVPTQGYPQTSGLLTTAYEEDSDYVYVYFFDNYTPGKLRVLRDKAGMTSPDPDNLTTETYIENGVEKTIQTACCLFTPSGTQAQYAICSPIADAEGNIYFKNDSAQLMCLSPTVTSLEITKKPEQTDYCIGQTFQAEGMKVTARLSNGLTKDISDAVSYTTEPLTADDTQITIAYDTDLYLVQDAKGSVTGNKAGYQDKDGQAGTVYHLPTATVDISIEEHTDADGGGRCDRCGQKISAEATDLSRCTVSVKQKTFTYTGEAKTPEVTLTDTDGYVLKAGTDYEVSYKDNVNAGTAQVVINGLGDYTGTASASFTIAKAAQKISVSAASKITAGSAVTVSVKGAVGSVGLASSNKKIASVSKLKVTGVRTGTVTMTVTAYATSNYLPATAKFTLKVLPKNTVLSAVSSPKKGQLKISWKKNTTADYYQIQYSTSKSFSASNTKTLLINKNTTVSTTVKKLKKKTIYYVRIRGLDAKKALYSGWSAAKKVKTK